MSNELQTVAEGQRAWHRVFGWGTVSRVNPHAQKCLFDSDHRHIQQYIAGKGWVDYIGENGGNIKTIYLPVYELFETEQKDSQQGLINMMVKVIS